MEKKNNLPEMYENVSLDNDQFTLKERDRQIALELILRQITGDSVQDIAERHGITRDMIYKMKKSYKGEFELFQKHIYAQVFDDLYGQVVMGMSEMLRDKNTPKALKVKLFGMILQAHTKQPEGVVINVNQPKSMTLQELEVLELEQELLGTKNQPEIIDMEEI